MVAIRNSIFTRSTAANLSAQQKATGIVSLLELSFVIWLSLVEKKATEVEPKRTHLQDTVRLGIVSGIVVVIGSGDNHLHNFAFWLETAENHNIVVLELCYTTRS